MRDPPTVCVVGSANIDLTFRTPRLPAAGETVAARDFHFGCGGKGANQAVLAARLGARVRLVATVGADAFGQQLVENLRASGVDTEHVGVDGTRPTGMAAVLVDDGARTRLHHLARTQGTVFGGGRCRGLRLRGAGRGAAVTGLPQARG